MNKLLRHIPNKKLTIFDNNLRLGRLSSQLHFLFYCFNINLEYHKFSKLKNFVERNKPIFYKFTGKHKCSINYKKYKNLYIFKYLTHILKLSHKSVNFKYYAYN